MCWKLELLTCYTEKFSSCELQIIFLWCTFTCCGTILDTLFSVIDCLKNMLLSLLTLPILCLGVRREAMNMERSRMKVCLAVVEVVGVFLYVHACPVVSCLFRKNGCLVKIVFLSGCFPLKVSCT